MACWNATAAVLPQNQGIGKPGPVTHSCAPEMPVCCKTGGFSLLGHVKSRCICNTRDRHCSELPAAAVFSSIHHSSELSRKPTSFAWLATCRQPFAMQARHERVKSTLISAARTLSLKRCSRYILAVFYNVFASGARNLLLLLQKIPSWTLIPNHFLFFSLSDKWKPEGFWYVVSSHTSDSVRPLCVIREYRKYLPRV